MFYLSRAEQIAVVVLLLLFFTGAGLLTYTKGQQSSEASQLLIEPVTTAPTELVVEVAGAVFSPGVYRLPPGARVNDAIEMAGGAKPEAELQFLNLAAPIIDGSKILVLENEELESDGTARTTSSAGGIISLNRATQQQLESLPGIGPVYASRIIAYREKKKQENGLGFESAEELMNIPGIGPKRYVALRDLVRP